VNYRWQVATRSSQSIDKIILFVGIGHCQSSRKTCQFGNRLSEEYRVWIHYTQRTMKTNHLLPMCFIGMSTLDQGFLYRRLARSSDEYKRRKVDGRSNNAHDFFHFESRVVHLAQGSWGAGIFLYITIDRNNNALASIDDSLTWRLWKWKGAPLHVSRHFPDTSVWKQIEGSMLLVAFLAGQYLSRFGTSLYQDCQTI
jgi:hypothetical protein